MGDVHLSIGTSADRINLVDPISQIVSEWEPSEIPFTDTFSESALGDGRQLSAYREENAIENMSIHLKGSNPNSLIRVTQNLRRMLIRARNYWVTAWQGSPVYLAARGACETNMRYALVYTGRIPEDIIPWGYEFARANVMANRTMVLERGPWSHVPPGTGACIDITASQTRCFPGMLAFGGEDAGDVVDCHSDAQVDDLPDTGAGVGYILAEAWIRPNGYGGNNVGTIMGKVYWKFNIHSVLGLEAAVTTNILQARSSSGLDEFSVDGEWHHVVMVYDKVPTFAPAAKTVYLAIDGIWVLTYPTQQQGNGNYNSDVAESLTIGSCEVPNEFDGDIGWARVSIVDVYTVGIDFTPPLRCTVPVPTVNTMGLWIYEGTGVTTANRGAGATAATITGATWGCDCPEVFGYNPDEEREPVYDWWDPANEDLCVWAAYQPKGAANYAASKLDLSGNGNNCADGGIIPTWNVVDGWVFSNAVADYLATAFVCASDQSQTILVQFTNGAAALRSIFGSSDAGNKDCWINPNGGLGVVEYANGGVASIGPALANGNLGFAGNQGYRNGVADGGAIPGWAGATAKPVWIGATSTGSGNQWWGEIQSFVIYNCVLTDVQVMDVVSAMAAL